jgi:hypothetical protein
MIEADCAKAIKAFSAPTVKAFDAVLLQEDGA